MTIETDPKTRKPKSVSQMDEIIKVKIHPNGDAEYTINPTEAPEIRENTK